MVDIKVEDVTKTFRSRSHPDGLCAIDRVDLSVPDGQFLCLLGPSGCGKSTLLNIIGGLHDDFTGRVTFGGRRFGADAQRPASIGFVFQEPRLLPWLTIRDNIRFALSHAKVARDRWNDVVEHWLARVGLASFGLSYPHELSGGMQHRAAVARAFAVDPDVMLMDEPLSGLDELTARDMRRTILDLWRETGKTVLFVTHNCFEACYVGERIVIFTPRPAKIAHDVPVALRNRDYDSTELFELSVAVTRLVIDPTSRETTEGSDSATRSPGMIAADASRD